MKSKRLQRFCSNRIIHNFLDPLGALRRASQDRSIHASITVWTRELNV